MTDYRDRIPVKPSELVWIVWRDAQELSIRATDDEYANATLAENINLGYVVHENADRILLSHGNGSTKENDVFVIPANAIIARLPVIKKRERKPKP